MQPRDKIIPWYFVMFFALIFLVNGVMVTLAIRSHTGTVTEHPYEKGLAYNRVVEAEERQEALGWRGDMQYADGILSFALRDKNGRNIAPEKGIVVISRPTQAGMDFTVPLAGAQTPLHFPERGLWEVRIEAEASGQRYQQAQRVVAE
jgi:nitrogen fixation protein FixH